MFQHIGKLGGDGPNRIRGFHARLPSEWEILQVMKHMTHNRQFKLAQSCVAGRMDFNPIDLSEIGNQCLEHNISLFREGRRQGAVQHPSPRNILKDKDSHHYLSTPMKLIPVIDLKNARAVTAESGKRHAYAPSDTPLCHSSQPREVLSALLNIHPFDTLYIADLDAIGGIGSNLQLIRTLCHDFSDITFWVDNGLTDLEPLCAFARPVIGSESLDDYDQFAHLIASLPLPVLSLDYLDDRFKGPASLEQTFAGWPEDIIVMTLSRVGTSTGPDLTRLERLSNLQPMRHFYAAGGVRNLLDLERLRSIGAAGVLLSTALHQGAIGSREIDRFLNARL
ncbi:MAG: hypothetical protein B6D72_10675 [gamma proteobacterium symbiont of Ctena orbiculata]|nr:MAG: hypothetical protein B6D82_15035 [gamma proteobacterium symbiont of Ctena orbiculata]PVV11256.1 MAG: hypothetical protein B6D72_10675 [gamma proteobacterium symbiont of Ctena orbiculata]PVV22191.1 MAG: hypothetical protein B6D74_10320 [gamma proteobacterium symbiont of Ctena orbiculata]